jgi:hypothetical protein
MKDAPRDCTVVIGKKKTVAVDKRWLSAEPSQDQSNTRSSLLSMGSPVHHRQWCSRRHLLIATTAPQWEHLVATIQVHADTSLSWCSSDQVWPCLKLDEENVQSTANLQAGSQHLTSKSAHTAALCPSLYPLCSQSAQYSHSSLLRLLHPPLPSNRSTSVAQHWKPVRPRCINVGIPRTH